MTTPVAPWSTMKTLFDKFSWEEIFPSMESYINGIVMNGFISGDLAQWQFVQTGDLIFLTTSFVAVACVILASIEASYSAYQAYYSDYGAWQPVGGLLYLWEILLIAAW
jgi:hypothetical protein